MKNNKGRETRIVLITTMCATGSLALALHEVTKEHGNIVALRNYYLSEVDTGLIDEERLKEDLNSADIVLLDMRGQTRGAKMVMESLSRNEKTIVTLCGGTTEILSLTKMGSFNGRKIFERQPDIGFDKDSIDISTSLKIMDLIKKTGKILPFGTIRHARNWAFAIDYWQYGGMQNLKNLLLLLVREYGGKKRIRFDPPMIPPKAGIYHPSYNRFFSSIDEFKKVHDLLDEKPKVGIFFYGGMHFDDCLPVVKALTKRLEPDLAALPVFSDVMTNLETIDSFFFKDGKPFVDAVINLQYFRINGGPLGGDPVPTLEMLRCLDCPVFGPIHMYQTDIERWRESETGLSPIEVVIAVALRELDGCIEPMVLSGLINAGFSKEIQNEVKAPSFIDNRMERFCNRLKKRLSLGEKENKKKRIALIIYDYPPGEHNLGNASYLDVFSSMKKILSALRTEGYFVEIPEEEISDLLLEEGIVNSPQWCSQEAKYGLRVPIEKYLKWFNDLPRGIQAEVVEKWGNPPGEIMTDSHGIMIPGIILGNIFIGIQPSRGGHEDGGRSYHHRDLPPHHQYLAFYHWIEREFQADALVHVGTHGTLEFTKGKEVGLSSYCLPDILTGDMPHIYIYWVTNSSEATIAKRRSYATIVNHQTPSFTTSGLYEELVCLEELIHEYYEARVQDPVRADRVSEDIYKRAKDLNMKDTSIEEIQGTLFEVKRSIIPRGLHILGEGYSKGEIIELIALILRYDQEVESLYRIVGEARGFTYEELLKSPAERKEDRCYDEILAEIEDQVKELVGKKVGGHTDEQLMLTVPKSLRKRAKTVFDYIGDLYTNIMDSKEIESFLGALCSQYTLPNIGGDPIRTPEVFPTGCNTYQFDPRLIPSSAACRRGAEIAKASIDEYKKAEDRYPETVSVVLWGFETVKTRGETIGQILEYLGLKAVRKSGPWFTGLEVIPLEILERPRIDVVVTICGIFRDTLPNLIDFLNEAFKIVSSLPEPTEMNMVKKHSQEIASKLSLKKDETLAHLRIFGPGRGEYATSMTTLIETSCWEDENELSLSYLDSMQYGYGENVNAESVKEVFETLLSRVDLVTQVRDTHEIEITELDHYYEFFGGLAKSIESVKGEKPRMLIADTTKEFIQVEDIKSPIERSIRARILNPKWIDGMLEHTFHGVQKISDRVEYILGLAATTGKVESWVFSDMAKRYIFDEEMQKRLLENNPFATLQIIKKLWETDKRGYWQTDEQEKENLLDAYLEIEGILEEKSD
ncbi:MAG: magnesium chelatase subunit H [Thermodesulfobacteriota bacterium]|nr:magnesium chelatase subunit H [Thermodesulfobacteriota bacterium]